MPVPNNIRKEHIISAIREVDRSPWPRRRNPKKHHLLYDGRLYPVKYPLSLASKQAGNEELSPDDFTTNEGQSYLKRLGFTIVSHPSTPLAGNATGKNNAYCSEGIAVYINNSATDKRCPFKFPRTDITGEPNKPDGDTGRREVYKDAYTLIFYGNGGKPIYVGGDKQVANILIKHDYLVLDKADNTLRPGHRLERDGYLLRNKNNTFRLNPERFTIDAAKNAILGRPHRHETKAGAFYQAVFEGNIPVLLTDGMIAEDIEEISSNKAIDVTTRRTLIEARIGQGKFRRDVMARWEGTCAFSGCMTEAILRASHIKPWRECSNAERLDPANGLLLTANLDALFDRGLISFQDDGCIMISSTLSQGEQALLHLGEGHLRGILDADMRNYLVHHRKSFIT